MYRHNTTQQPNTSPLPPAPIVPQQTTQHTHHQPTHTKTHTHKNQAIPPFARGTLCPLFGPLATQRLARAALNARADTGYHAPLFSQQQQQQQQQQQDGGEDAAAAAAARNRPLREAVLQALLSLPPPPPTDADADLGQGEEEEEGEGELRPPRLVLDFGPSAVSGGAAGVGAWVAGLGGWGGASGE